MSEIPSMSLSMHLNGVSAVSKKLKAIMLTYD